MHTIYVLAGGFALLSACLAIGKFMASGHNAGAAKGALAFIPLWLAASLVNMWVGVSHAGYTVSQEAPILLVVFGVPAAVALVMSRVLGRR